ncbi:MAG: elongation factor P hydroxylase [Parahaliea sp.]
MNACATGQKRFASEELVAVFAHCFADLEQTRLIGGASEPLYVPAGEWHEGEVSQYHRLYFREDYFASALHEISHWCIAGPERRQQRDFGYWYAPDGRSPQQQQAFQTVEVRPQALEWCFAQACGFRFQVSLDNLAGGEAARCNERHFIEQVCKEGLRLQAQGLPLRAARFFAALAQAFHTGLTEAGLSFNDYFTKYL